MIYLIIDYRILDYFPFPIPSLMIISVIVTVTPVLEKGGSFC